MADRHPRAIVRDAVDPAALELLKTDPEAYFASTPRPSSLAEEDISRVWRSALEEVRAERVDRERRAHRLRKWLRKISR